MLKKIVTPLLFSAIVVIVFMGCLWKNEVKGSVAEYGQVSFIIKDTCCVFHQLNVVKSEVLFKNGMDEPYIKPLNITDSSAEGTFTDLVAGTQYTFEISLSDSLGRIFSHVAQSDTVIKNQSTDVSVVVSEKYLKDKFPLVFSTSPVQLLDLRINEEIQGWRDSAKAFSAYNVQELYGIINGGADFYRDLGLVKGILQEMGSANGNVFQGYVMDFGAPEKARACFDQSKIDNGGNLPLPVYPQCRAITKGVLGGVEIYAHFDKYFFEFSLTGYNETAQAISDGVLFLNFYRGKCQATVKQPA